MPIESYEDDDEEQEAPRSSFGTYLAEGDSLFKQSEYKKALESYSLALELKPNDKTCLVARSKCYLKLGDPQKALRDAEDALSEDKEFNKGLYRKAEALYCMGDFEYALMYYHRGHKLRPELDEFRLGIQKAQEAIDNSIGSAAKIKLKNKGDLSFFSKQDVMQVSKTRGGYLKPVGRPGNSKLKPLGNRNKEVKPPAPSKKTVKQLLGELYSDKEYLDKLMDDEDFIKSHQNNQIYELVQGGLDYLETRTEFWRQQKPLYARKKEKANFKSTTSKKKTKPSVSKYVLKQLEDIDLALSSGDSDRSLRLAQKLLKFVEKLSRADLPTKDEVLANIYSCIGNAYIEMEMLAKALRYHEKDLQLSKESNSLDGKSRALDNVGRVHARMGNFKKAVESWNEKLPLVKASLESTWLFHEIGRCHLELGNNEKAAEFGKKSLEAGIDCEDEVWQLNATVLIAQSQVKIGDVVSAFDTFSTALQLATALSDTAAHSAISKAITDLQRRSASGSNRITGSPRYSSQSENEETDPSDIDGGAKAKADHSNDEDTFSSREQSPTEGGDEIKEERSSDEPKSDDIYGSDENEKPFHVTLAEEDISRNGSDAERRVGGVAGQLDDEKMELERDAGMSESMGEESAKLNLVDNEQVNSRTENDHDDGDISATLTADEQNEASISVDESVTGIKSDGEIANDQVKEEKVDNKESLAEDVEAGCPQIENEVRVSPLHEDKGEDVLKEGEEKIDIDKSENVPDDELTADIPSIADDKESEEFSGSKTVNGQSCEENEEAVADIGKGEGSENEKAKEVSDDEKDGKVSAEENGLETATTLDVNEQNKFSRDEQGKVIEVISDAVESSGSVDVAKSDDHTESAEEHSGNSNVEDMISNDPSNENLAPNTSSEYVTSSVVSAENITSQERTTEDHVSGEVSTEDISHDISTENVTSHEITTEGLMSEEVSVADISRDISTENIVSADTSMENVSQEVSTENTISHETSTEDVTSTHGTENINSHDISTENTTSHDITGNTLSRDISSELVTSHDVSEENMLHDTEPNSEISGDKITESVKSDSEMVSEGHASDKTSSADVSTGDNSTRDFSYDEDTAIGLEKIDASAENSEVSKEDHVVRVEDAVSNDGAESGDVTNITK